MSRLTSSTMEPPERLGPPGLVVHADESRLWLLLKQEEQKRISISTGRYSSGSSRRETRYHFELHCYDTRTAEPLWKKRLLTLKDGEAGHSAQGRILGQDGDKVWIFLKDQPIALSPADGSVLAGREAIEQRNAQLKGLLPSELEFYTFDNGLVITAADALRYKVASSDYMTARYTPENEERFSRARFMSTQWNGGYQTDDFLTRQANRDGEWFGLLSEKEAADAREDGFGDKYRDASRILKEGPLSRRSFWKGRIGRTREFSEGSHPRLIDLVQVPDTADFLQGGLLLSQGTKQPLTLRDPSGLVVVHRTRIDAEGRLALTRVDGSFRPVWSTTLPCSELHSRWQWSDRLLLIGSGERVVKGSVARHEYIVSVAIADGFTLAWDVMLARKVE